MRHAHVQAVQHVLSADPSSRLTTPVNPISPAVCAQLREGGYENEDLMPWAQLHRGPVAALAVQPDTGELLTAGADGCLFLLPALVRRPAASLRVV